uniref:Integrase_H2C2 domain-containing protein n=1 Tax=Heligmosomoides polygyrus TaxID=6339 RepID=A0A183FVZ8_HELPZ
LLRTLQGDKEKFNLYNDTLTSYLQDGIIEEGKEEDGRLATFYPPHRHVWTPSKSTKLRVVFAASSHAGDELSLNDVIYEGHSLTPLIHEVLLKFRTHLYTMCVEKHSVKVSRRTVLSQMNRYCFDPLGLLTLLLIPAEIFLQDLHKKKAYACSICVTTISCGNREDSRLFTEKSKIAPISKEQTIPRLELLSIFIGLSLAESTIQRIDTKFEQINIFSDSTIALCWVHGNRRRYCKMTAKRESTRVVFFHVPTNENVADCATRGVGKDDLAKHRWWSGPIWLNQPSELWLVKKAEDLCQQNSGSEYEAALYASNTEEHTVVPIWPTEKFSSCSKLVRIVAYCARFIRNATKGRCLPLPRKGQQTESPSAEEATIAERLIIRQEQTIFKSELLLQNTQLNARIDNEGIYMRFGRLQNADLRFSTVNPIHIPKQSKLGPLIALNLHKALAHCGSNQLLYYIRRRFWIPFDRTLCKRTLKNCSTCRKANAVPYKYPSMGPLPTERVTQSPPFSYTVVDFLGPITTKSSSGEDCKRYVALFTCLVTRLVHLQVSMDLSAKNFIFAHKRFARRG